MYAHVSLPQKLREEILVMKQYFLDCSDALRTDRLLCQVERYTYHISVTSLFDVPLELSWRSYPRLFYTLLNIALPFPLFT